ncbi:Furin-like protease 2 [Folsomia candida]|uniref:Furin-like protease 2 n=1 Tax=Folsomia candida TaxID=158441 RepID=A0A226EUI1_FOLCA|nr:Furin-like protease 2 [Folsomia candida]
MMVLAMKFFYDTGKTVDGPGPLARRAFIYGVTNGRRGLGSIFIWASGNGGRHVDSCNCDGYTNSIFTLSISSATQGGYKPWYLEECASTLATTYSSGTPTLDKSVATVDMDGRLRPDHICTVEHTGTSASAPLAAGIAALALEANPNLTWRDLQHLVVMTSRPDPLVKEEGWYVNGVQRKFSHKFGYGLMDAGKMVDLAVDWGGVPPQHICKSREIREDREIPGAHLGKVKVFMDVDGCAGTNSEIRYLEHVQCKISLRFFPRGNLRILLTSPMGTTSVLLFERPRDVSVINPSRAQISMTGHFYPFIFGGNKLTGNRWTLEIINSGSRRINQPGILKKWQLILYGTDLNPQRLRSRSLSNPTFQPSSSQFREAQSQGSPRFVPQDYLYPGASESLSQVQKPQMVRSQCQIEYWISDLAICVNDCPDGYFADSSCEKCPVKSCAACAGPMGNECVQCLKGTYLENGKCSPKCGTGRRQSSSGSCIACPVGCKSCDENVCTSCIENFTPSSDSSSCEQSNTVCPLGLFLDIETGQCQACQAENCQRCEGAGQCLQCAHGFYVYLGTCLDQCSGGSYLTSNRKECLDCPKLCTKCKSAEICEECRTDGMLQEGKCLPHCSEGYYNDVGTCSRCSQSCKTCIGPGESECVTCVSGRKLSRSGRCVNLNSTTTKSGPTMKSEKQCADGYWYSRTETKCQSCHPSCSKCNGPMPYNCRNCVTPLRLDRGSSRCISCCKTSEDLDCCHCDTKRHTGTPLTADVDGECHFVSRRVSESEEREISSGKWSDSTVLSVFWFSVFTVVVVSVLVIFRRRRKSADNSYNSGPRYSSQKNLFDHNHTRSSAKYSPVNVETDSYETNHNDGVDSEDEVDLTYADTRHGSEGIPLVLKT